MVQMDNDRIARWKCLMCGSRQKKIIDLIDTNNKHAGYSIMCCNCGHIDSFAYNYNGVVVATTGDTKRLKKINIYCGYDYKELQHCTAHNCNYRPKRPPMDSNSVQKNGNMNSNSSVSPEPTEINPDTKYN